MPFPIAEFCFNSSLYNQACYTVAFGLYHDDWTYLDAFYFTFDTFTTIGFGDLAIEPRPCL